MLFSRYDTAAWLHWFILLCLIADFADGFAARLLKAYSPLGKQLDSLADLISFGFLPAAMVFQLLRFDAWKDQAYFVQAAHSYDYAAFLITAFSALRLARFNIDNTQTDSFRGLATPANTIFIAGFYFMANSSAEMCAFICQPYFLFTLIAVSCFLLVSPISMFSFKFKSYGIRGNELRYFFLICAAALLVLWRLNALSAIIGLYITLSILHSLFSKKQNA